MNPPSPSKSTIMIIDDEHKNLEYLKQLLDQFGFEILMAPDGHQAFAILEATLPDIILLDVLMPEIDGFEVCRRLKANPHTKDIPVILMTDLSESVNKVTGLELGAADYITKPFQDEEVLTRIKTHFVMRQLQEQLKQTRKSLRDSAGIKDLELEKSYEHLKQEMAEQKRMEKIFKQAQKMEAISTLSRGIAHDFNNILSIIIGYGELAALEKLPEDSTIGPCLEKINSAAFRARELVQNLLTFCRETEQEKTRIKIAPIIKYVLNYLKSSLPATIEIKIDIQEETGTVLADPSLIHQMILNFCQNASQAMTDTGGTLYVALRQIFLGPEKVTEYPNLVSGSFVSILIQDTGPGMVPEIVDRIFDPYFTTKEPGEGKGLGMSVAHGIVTSHGGTILVESNLNKGSSFEILLPSKQTKRSSSDPTSGSKLPTGQGTVLFVDDEESLVDFGTIVLKKAGYLVQGYTSPLEALDIIKTSSEKFDLVITDHIMPKLHGMELAQKILEIRKDLPILLCTGTKSDELVEHAKAIGIVKVIQKPVPMKTLINTINNILTAD
ncbi:MAG: response regulator [Desulfobacula sp.]|nr:response regulator [Desulfobacula sp.]